MMDIVFIFLVFCIGFVSVGVLGTRQIYETITKFAKNKGMKVVENPNVYGAAVNMSTKEINIDPERIKEETDETAETVSEVVDNNPEFRKLLGLENTYNMVKSENNTPNDLRYESLHKYSEKLASIPDILTDYISTINLKRIVEHEKGHTLDIDSLDINNNIKNKIKSGGNEVEAESARAFNDDGSLKELSYGLIQEYLIGFYNTIKYGGEEGLKNVMKTYEIITELYKDVGDKIDSTLEYTIKDIPRFVNECLDVSYKKNKHNIA